MTVLVLAGLAAAYWYLFAGLCIADLITRDNWPGLLRFIVAVLIWPVLAAASVIGLAREAARAERRR